MSHLPFKALLLQKGTLLFTWTLSERVMAVTRIWLWLLMVQGCGPVSLGTVRQASPASFLKQILKNRSDPYFLVYVRDFVPWSPAPSHEVLFNPAQE